MSMCTLLIPLITKMSCNLCILASSYMFPQELCNGTKESVNTMDLDLKHMNREMLFSNI